MDYFFLQVIPVNLCTSAHTPLYSAFESHKMHQECGSNVTFLIHLPSEHAAHEGLARFRPAIVH